MKKLCFPLSVLTILLASVAARAQFPKIELPKMPHIPEPKLRVPDIRIPPIKLPIPIGHKTNKWNVRHNLEKNGWWVAYGKEIGYQEYYEFSQAVAASVASENPTPAMAYLQALVTESVAVLTNNAGAVYGNKLRNVAQKELVSVFYDAVKNGRVRTISLSGLEVQLGMATYNRSESGVPLPNTFQPYLRVRMKIKSGDLAGGGGQLAKYHWVTTIYNPTDVVVNYSFSSGAEWKNCSVAARGWRWHSHDSASPPSFKIDFDMGPPVQHKHKEYHLNYHRLFIGTAPADSKGEPYTFRYSSQMGWDLYRGRP